MRRRRWVGLLICTLAGTVVSTVWAQPISCGATLGPGGVFVLQADLLCATPLTVRDGARLDLGGHLVTGAPVAVLLEGRGAVLEHGRAESGDIAGVRLAGAGGHTVRGVEAAVFSPTFGFEVLSDDNRLLDNVGISIGSGFWVVGHRNRLVRNTGGGQSGFYVLGQQNVLLSNVSLPGLVAFGFGIAGHQNRLLGNEAGGAEQGFYVWGDGNRLTGNVVRQAVQGILVSGQSNVIVHNTALDNRIDLMDVHPDCDGNRWADNIFQTADPACAQGVPARQASR
jgi:Right handed beta helix region